MASILLLLVLGFVQAVPLPNRTHEECGYQNCPKSDPSVLNVHIVAHTHDDVGWLKTVDQYYYGSRNNIQKAGVQYILDSVVHELWEDPKRRFIYVETAFFWKWWVRQTQKIQSQVRTLVAEARLQFVGGAWSMNDEAAVHYHSTIDQFTWGLSKINQTFGACALPRVGWQIDPFGHSREFASLLAGMGYDGLFLGRIDYQDKGNRLAKNSMEMLWRGDDDLGPQSDIFTGVLYNTYSPPPGFCFDVLCSDEPIIDDIDSPMYNVDDKVGRFIEISNKMADSYSTSNILVTMGDDFQYMDARMWFTNLDKLIQYTNLKAAKDGLNIKLFYSTPNCYLKAVKDADPVLPVKQDDFFPYASDPHSYWSGYFTSRPTTKYFERQANAYLQMAKQLQVLSGLELHNQFMLNSLRSAMGVMQHHDAITGTEKQHVTHDYERLLHEAIDNALVVPRQAFTKLMQGDARYPPLLSYDRCRLNESSCHTSEEFSQLVVTVYNPVAWAVRQYIRLPVTFGVYEVYAPNGDKIASSLAELMPGVVEIPTRDSRASHQLVFEAHLQGLMIKAFYIKNVTVTKVKREASIPKEQAEEIYKIIDDYYKERVDKPNLNNQDDLEVNKRMKDMGDIDLVMKDNNSDKDMINENIPNINENKDSVLIEKGRETLNFPNLNDDEMRMLSDDPVLVDRLEDFFVMENEYIKVHIDNTSGAIRRVSFGGLQADLSVSVRYYRACVGNNEIPANRSSGAYIFRPNDTSPQQLEPRSFKFTRNKLFSEHTITWDDSVHTAFRLYNGDKHMDVEWLISIDVTDNIGKEYVLVYETDLINNGEFYTDSNGRQMLKRKLNQRPQWNVTIAEPIGGNYYPVTNEIYIQNKDTRFTVMPDRAEGGSSIREGEIELMVHRRLLHDDAFGVGEALNETGNSKPLAVIGTHRVFLSNISHEEKTNVEEEKTRLETHLPIQVFVSDAADMTLESWLKMKNCYTWMKEDLPEGLHLLTLEPWGHKLLLRLENYLSSSDNSTKEVDLTNLLKNIKVRKATEMTLSAQEEKTREQWKWKTKRFFSESFNKEYGSFDEVVKAVDNDEVNPDEADDGFNIKIAAKQIKTYIVEYDYE